MKTAQFNRFEIQLPDECVADCSRPGVPADDDVKAWANKIGMTIDVAPDLIRAELAEYGAWDAEELADDVKNLHRIIWLAAGNIREDENQNFN
jgi:hypothetical protein